MKTSILFNGGKRTLDSDATYIVFGCARGGTSMVAGCMVALGLHMGNNLPQNYEDPEFVNQPLEKMCETVKRKNQHHRRWGWKYPEAAHYLGSMHSSVRNPRFIIVFRDLVAIANRQKITNNIDTTTSLTSNMLLQQKNILLALQWEAPTLAVSYEKAIANNESFLEDLASFIEMDLPEERSDLIEFMKPGKYKSTYADRYVV